MTQRWHADRVLALASDSASVLAARTLAAPASWSDTGAADDLVWGTCRGSSGQRYDVLADTLASSTSCTCPSRKVPCKHALALLLLWAAGDVPDRSAPAETAVEWRTSRRTAVARPRGERDEAAALRRAEQRTDRVAAGLRELETWLADQVRGGLATARWGHADAIAARMVDAQAPGVAGQLRRLSTVPASGDGWPARLLAGYGRLHLLARAHERLDELPAPLAATVRSYVGYTVSRESVLAQPSVRDEWLVAGVRDLLDGAVPGRRIWLRGHDTGQWALVLVFDPTGAFAQPDASLAPGTTLSADLHFYPATPPLRVVVGDRFAEDRPGGAPGGAMDLATQLDEWAAALALDPWLPEWPALVRGVPVAVKSGWRFADATGGVPMLTSGIDPQVLAAVAGGQPIPVFGEWSADGFRPLTTWHGERAVAA